MNDEIREVIKEVCIDTGSPVVLLHYYETAQDVMTAKEIRLSSGGETRLQCLGKYLERVNAYMSERVVCQLVLGYVDNQLEEQAGKIMRENKRREQQRCVPIPPTPQHLLLFLHCFQLRVIFHSLLSLLLFLFLNILSLLLLFLLLLSLLLLFLFLSILLLLVLLLSLLLPFLFLLLNIILHQFLLFIIHKPQRRTIV